MTGFVLVWEKRQLRLRFWVERTERRWLVVTIGILRCAQNDGRNLQRQVQEQLQKQGQLQRQLQGQGSCKCKVKGSCKCKGDCKSRATAGLADDLRPTHRKCAMDGAPRSVWADERWETLGFRAGEENGCWDSA
jgi:hypothetical protein